MTKTDDQYSDAELVRDLISILFDDEEEAREVGRLLRSIPDEQLVRLPLHDPDHVVAATREALADWPARCAGCGAGSSATG